MPEKGTPEVWIFDPEQRAARCLTHKGLSEPLSGTLALAGIPIALELAPLFAVLDR